MFDKLINIPLIKGNSVAGIFLNILPEGTYVYDLMILKMNKDKLEIVKSVNDISLLEEISEIVGGNMPVILSVDGKAILHKKVKTTNDRHSLLSKILPNASQNDFHLQQTEIFEEESFVSVIRKELFDKILADFKSYNLYVIDVILGPFVLNTIQPIIEQTDHPFIVPGYKLSKNENIITNFVKEEKDCSSLNYQIGDHTISSHQLIPLAAGFSFFYPFYRVLELDGEIDQNEKHEFFYKKLFTYLGWGILIFFFAILIVNYLMFSQYNKKRNILEYKKAQNTGLLTKLSKLKNEVEQKEQFLADNGYLEPSKLSYYSDRLAYLLLKKISLTGMNANPLKKEAKKGKEMEFEKKQIIVSGTTPNSEILSNYIQKIKDEEWVSEVNILNYMQESSSSPGEFEIEIII